MISCSCGKLLGVPPHTPHISHVHLCIDPHNVSQYSHDAATQMLQCGTCVTLLSDCMIFLPHSKTFVPHHSEALPTQPP